MDPANSTAVKPTSGIPRVSKLPVNRTRPSQIPNPVASVKSDSQITQSRVPATATSTKPPISRLQKRTSINNIPQTSKAATTVVAPKRSSIQAPKPTLRESSLNNNSAKHGALAGRTSSIRVPSNGGRLRSGLPGLRPPSQTAGDDETHDRLGSLNRFRSVSRQSGAGDSELGDNDDAISVASTSRGYNSSQPSLSDRTVESLQSLPSTPKDRRRSSFFSNLDSPTNNIMPPLIRPLSDTSRDGQVSSRPGTSDGSFGMPAPRSTSPTKKYPASAKPATRTSLGGFGFGNNVRRNVSTASSHESIADSDLDSTTPKPAPSARSTITNNQSSTLSRKVLSNRRSKQELAIDVQALRSKSKSPSILSDSEKTPRPINSSQTAKTGKTSQQSSSALREQIAAAKAAARIAKTAQKQEGQHHFDTQAPSIDDLQMHHDPFNQLPGDDKHILRTRINRARNDGKLNIAGLGLKEIPEEVMTMYDAAVMERDKVNWAEVVDLTKLIAADNDLEKLDDLVFPDRSIEDLASDEDAKGNQFGGLDTLDLHGNVLSTLPMGLRRLQNLTSLNLARNKLENSVLDLISEIPSLRELKLGNNQFSGNLPANICQLAKLERLELQENRLLGLPEALRSMSSLKVLNVSGNQLTTIPMEALQQLPLMELDASNNALIASLFPLGSISSHPTLQVLKIANNSLAALAFSEMLSMPQLRTLDVSNNHLTLLPPLNGWPELLSLSVADNKLTDIPIGFTALRKLRGANFTNNEIRLLDPDIGLMDCLEVLTLAANPLREKKFLTMAAVDIRKDLKARLEPDDISVDSRDDEVWADAVEHGSRPSTATGDPSWTMKTNGVLDLSSKNLSHEINDTLGSYLRNNDVHTVLLQSNNLATIPTALSFGTFLTSLDLSGNAFASEYLTQDLSMLALTQLNLARCRINDLILLQRHLSAPSLQSLDVTGNRLTGPLPHLREIWTDLKVFLASDNRFSSISAESLRGFQTVNLASNDIERLPPEVGLLWDEGLRKLEVGSNVFRVPNYRVLEKGTAATLQWLRDRLPGPQSTVE